MDMTVKAYACHASFHPIIDGIHKFVAEHGPGVQSLSIAGTKRMVDRHGQREPETVLGAQYSLPFSAAVAVCRDIADPSVYNDETLWDPRSQRPGQESGTFRRRAVRAAGRPGR